MFTKTLGSDQNDRDTWIAIKSQYSELISDWPDSEFFKTFFSSITRRIFATVGVDADVEYVALDVTPNPHPDDPVPLCRYHVRGNLEFAAEELLSDFRLSVPYRNLDRSAQFVTAEIAAYCTAEQIDPAGAKLENH